MEGRSGVVIRTDAHRAPATTSHTNAGGHSHSQSRVVTSGQVFPSDVNIFSPSMEIAESHTNLQHATGGVTSHSHVNTFRDTTTVIREEHHQVGGNSHTGSNLQNESLRSGETARLRKQIQDLKNVLEILETKNKTLEDNQSNFNNLRDSLMTDNKKLLLE